MENPICLSQYFVNKQNVRSYTNIFKWNLLKNKEGDGYFLRDIFEEQRLVSEVSTDIQEILLCLKANLRDKGKNDFQNHFSTVEIKPGALIPVNKSEIFSNSMTVLNEIIPRKFFGDNHNAKIFKKLVQSVLFSMKRQYFQLWKMIEKWNFNSTPWNTLPEEWSKQILHKILIWIVKNILSAMICLNFYVTSCKLDSDENKLYFFWKSQWQSFYDKKISKMIFTRVLKRCNPYCLGKKVKKNHSLNARLKLKSVKKGIPKLNLVLKPNSDCRPIVHYKSQQSTSEKYKMKDRLKFLKALTGKSQKKVDFENIYKQWLASNKPKLYFIKTDLSNAFGSINKGKLLKIISERHMKFQKTEKSMYLKQKIAQQYKEMVAELKNPLLIRAGNTVYMWTEGLVQGYKYSPALSELYYTHLDETYFGQHLKTEDSKLGIKFFIRVVDDYLYITDCKNDANSFLNALASYRNVNYEKTVVNFEHESIKYSDEITFLGYSYNTNTLEVSRASNVCVGQMCYKIAFSSASANLNKFLENRIGQSGIQINSQIFNFVYNSEELVWKHIFTTFCLSANKFCTILSVLCEDKEITNYLTVYKKRVTVKLTNTIIETLTQNMPVGFLFMYCINHFRYLSFKALYLCAKNTSKCSGLVPLINNELAKSNCLFGKWKDHACRIDSNGEMRRKAIKQICRRTDLRVIVKSFISLPEGFQCFNHKKIL